MSYPGAPERTAAAGSSIRLGSRLLRHAVGVPRAGLILWCGLTFTAVTIALFSVAYTHVQQSVVASRFGCNHLLFGLHNLSGRSLDELAPLGLQRSRFASSLEEAVEGDATVGVCTASMHMLSGMFQVDCTSLYCMWSPHLHVNIDFWYNALQPFENLHNALLEPCHEPRGGQIYLQHAPIQLAFIITVHNNAKLAAEVLLETFRAAGEVESAEIVVVDDGSTEDMRLLREACRRLSAFFGSKVQYLVNEQAMGFGAASMQGVHASSAKFVMLLNSDVFLVKGAAYALLRTIQEVPKASIVGPLFIGPDQMVRDAGGILFSNGEAVRYGWGQQIEHDLNYRRPVDYVAATCIVFKKDVFLDVGGFDTQYRSADYLGADLAMAMRSRGLHVVYQPLAVVLHQQNSTLLGTNSSLHKQAMMKADREVFAAKWEKQLKQHCPRASGDKLAAHRRLFPKVLWVDDLVPETDRDSGSIRTWNMLQVLVQNGYHVSVQPTAGGRWPGYTQQARFGGVDVLPVPTTKWQLSLGVCMYDVILVARRYVFGPVKETIKKACPSVPIIYDTVDLHFLRESRDFLSASLPTNNTADMKTNMHMDWDFSRLSMGAVLKWLDSKDPQAAATQKKRDLELSLIDTSSLTIVVSDIEEQVIHYYRPKANVQVISNIHQITRQPTITRAPAPPSTCKGRRGFIFVGNLQHDPNRQAISLLLDTILPRAKELLPAELRQDFVLHIVGSNLPANKIGKQLHDLLRTAMTSGDVVFHGHLSEQLLKMLYSSVKAVVAPLLSGAGVKGKVNQAMKYGVPVVATPIAVEGMHVVSSTTCMVANNSEDFARKLVQVYRDCALWERLVEGGHDNVRQYFSVESARSKVLEAFNTVHVGPLQGRTSKQCVQTRGGGA